MLEFWLGIEALSRIYCLGCSVHGGFLSFLCYCPQQDCLVAATLEPLGPPVLGSKVVYALQKETIRSGMYGLRAFEISGDPEP